jgi:hypothetical protein
MYRSLMDATIGRYYGAVLEVARGCPFLCEFCDIRILPDTGRATGLGRRPKLHGPAIHGYQRHNPRGTAARKRFSLNLISSSRSRIPGRAEN